MRKKIYVYIFGKWMPSTTNSNYFMKNTSTTRGISHFVLFSLKQKLIL